MKAKDKHARMSYRRDLDKSSTPSLVSDTLRYGLPRFSLRRLFAMQRYRSKSKSSLDFDTGGLHTDDNASGLSIPASNTSRASSPKVSSTSAVSDSSPGGLTGPIDGIRECPLCLNEQEAEQFPEITTCPHRSCIDCYRQYLKIEITESRIVITCPECPLRLHPNNIAAIIDDVTLLHKYENFMVRRVLVSDPDSRWCPAPDCGYAVIATACAGCPKLKCERPGCDTYFCYHCKQYWHPNQTCDDARATRAQNMQGLAFDAVLLQGELNYKPCPRCGIIITKMNDGSCNHMTCGICGAEFCWLCMKEISDLHYLSPSGCTFWGKKPWSRKKKILWQLGTLVGAPVGISLVAGIAVPALIIGIPVWVGRKIHNHYQATPGHKRNLAITGGVTASIILAPIIAGLAVGIGVPILLAYVYGVVPISLCRSNGCGVTTTNTGGVRIDFDEENETGGGATGGFGAEALHHVANPSIAPSIGEASMAMTGSLSASGSNMDRVGVNRDESDRESASHRAIASISLNGSLCDSSILGVGATGYQHHRMEVQVDVSNNAHMSKRTSLSSESEKFSIGGKSNFSIGEKSTFSFGEKSATVSFSDDASTRALAGSITGNRENFILTLPSSEVQEGVLAKSSKHASKNTGNTEKSSRRGYSNNGSPTSTRSVNFNFTDETGNFSAKNIHERERSRKSKKFSLSLGDRINEHSDRSSNSSSSNTGASGAMRKKPKEDCLSMKSCPGDTGVDTRKPERCMKAPEENFSLKSYDGELTLLAEGGYKASPRSSPSCDSLTDDFQSEDDMPHHLTTNNSTTLTPIESDKPTYRKKTALQKSLSTGSVISSKGSKHSSTVAPTVPTQQCVVAITSRDFSTKSTTVKTEVHMQRRRSCELAIEHGRLSPRMMGEVAKHK